MGGGAAINVLLINPETERFSRSVTLPLGLLSIASYLSFHGYSVRLYDRVVEKESLETVAEAFVPDVVGVSLVSYKSIADVCFVSEFFKKQGIPVIWGGPLASELPEVSLKNACVDAISVGEGEQTWLELVQACQRHETDWSQIPGLVIRDPDGNALYTPDRPFLDLGILPETDWSFIDVPKYFQSSYGCKRMLYLYAAKGCPHNCSFCYNKDFHKCRYRKRPMEHVLHEIRFLVETYDMDGIYFADELWCRNVREMHETCDSLKSLGLNFVWGCQTRIGLFGEEDFRYMYDAGCRWIFFGVESGSPRILEQMNKRIAYDKIEQTFADCKAAGIVAIGSFIIGYPGETAQDTKQTIALIERLPTKLINFNYFIAIPGSDIYQRLVDEKRHPGISDFQTLEVQDPMGTLLYNFSELTDREIKVIYSHYMWRSFTTSDLVVDGEKSSFTKKVILDALHTALFSVKNGEFGAFLSYLWFSGVSFLRILFYAKAFPSVKKRFGIKH